MEIIRDLTAVHLPRPTALTIGSFDGIHRGHQFLIRQVIQRAGAIGAASALVTLHPHPKVVLRPDSPHQYLSTIEERLDLLAPLGLDYAVVFPFSLELSQLRAREFVQLLIDHLQMREIICGADFALGYKREGTMAFLRELGREVGFGVTAIDQQKYEGEVVSSTRIRGFIAQGDLESATRALGRHPSLRGRVVKGDQRGRELGFPTANLAVTERRLVPAFGIYAARVKIDEHWFGGAVSIGIRPTFSGQNRTIEVYVLDYSGDLYDQVIEVQFVKRLRPEVKFDTVEALIVQMHQDIADTRQVLAALP